MPVIDYHKLYDEYWSRADRAGSQALEDPAEVAEQILLTCGIGRVLDVGCGMGSLVRALLARGADAWGMDVSRVAVEQATSVGPNRFVAGSALGSPFGDEAFDTVVSTDALEHLAEEDVPAALAEMARLARRTAFVVLSTTADRDNQWHLSRHDRSWWEDRFFEAGFRKHPRAQVVLPYEALENEGPQITLILEKVPRAAALKYRPADLRGERDLHMDMLRETGRRSDAHIARYALACPLIRQGDVVVDAGCGLGYGAAILAADSLCARVIGVDESRSAIEYARTNYACEEGVVEFRHGNVADLSFLADESVDCMVAMEVIEHLDHPEAFLGEARRVLKRSGRLVLSVPNEWVDETGRDPNPHHRQVYTWERLRGELDGKFLLEKAYAQIAGGALRLPDGKRTLREVSIADAERNQAEWWIVVAMKDPIGGDKSGYRECNFPGHMRDERYHITAFDRDYDNPAIAKAMVIIGMRATNPGLLESLAHRTLAQARPGSADAGAALCVLAYRMLESDTVSAETIRGHLARIDRYLEDANQTAHAWRWRISNAYVAGRLLMRLGEFEAARQAFVRCAAMDPLRFSPLLGTKTVDALYYAGLIEMSRGHTREAAKHWQSAITEVRRLLGGDWLNVCGDPARPASFGLPEVAQLADLASRCAFGLLAMDRWPDAPGLAWARAQICAGWELARTRRAVTRLQVWSRAMQRDRAWLEQQRQAWEQTAQERERQITELKTWITQLEQTTRDYDRQVSELKDWIGQLEKSREWLAAKCQEAEHRAPCPWSLRAWLKRGLRFAWRERRGHD